MSAKRFLLKPDRIQDRIAELTDEMISLYESLGLSAIRYDTDRVNVSPEDSMSEVFARIDKIEREIKSLKVAKGKAYIEISLMLSKLPEGAERRILYDYYVGKKEMKDISKEIGYELSVCYKKRKEGLGMLERKLNEKCGKRNNNQSN